MTTQPDDQNPAGNRTKRRAALLPEPADNSIRPLRSRKPAPQVQSRADSAIAKSAEPQGARKPARPDQSRAMPNDVWERFIGIGSKFYFPDGTLAFADHGQKLTTKSENTELVRSLVSIAQVRGWGSIAVSGSERFRREAWFAAQAVGLTVKGYKATAVEQAQLVRSLGKRRAAEKQAERGEADARGGRRTESPAEAQESEEARRGAVYAGKLLAHGSETYRHDPLEQSSYFVRLKTKDGERELWGVDLERALRHSLSNAKIGDDVVVRAVRREKVTVPTPERNGQGEVIGFKSKATHRNGWIVERSDFLAERERLGATFRDEKIPAQEAVKQHPELQGSYFKLQAVHLGAERDFKNPKERQAIIARARVLIAESIERGEPLEPVQLRESPQRKPPEREQTMQR